MGIIKEEKSQRIIRVIKTIFFLITMLISFLFFCAPVLLAVADTILPSALLSASSPFLSPQSLSFQFSNYDFRYSLVDIPLISILRSLLIICKFFNSFFYFSWLFIFFSLIVFAFSTCLIFFLMCFFKVEPKINRNKLHYKFERGQNLNLWLFVIIPLLRPMT